MSYMSTNWVTQSESSYLLQSYNMDQPEHGNENTDYIRVLAPEGSVPGTARP